MGLEDRTKKQIVDRQLQAQQRASAELESTRLTSERVRAALSEFIALARKHRVAPSELYHVSPLRIRLGTRKVKATPVCPVWKLHEDLHGAGTGLAVAADLRVFRFVRIQKARGGKLELAIDNLFARSFPPCSVSLGSEVRDPGTIYLRKLRYFEDIDDYAIDLGIGPAAGGWRHGEADWAEMYAERMAVRILEGSYDELPSEE